MLRDIELGELPLTSVALRAARLARLTGDFELQQGFEAEAGGYGTNSDGVPPQLYQFALRIGRRSSGFLKSGQFSEDMISTVSIAGLEQQIASATITLTSSVDSDPHTQRLLQQGQPGLTPKAIARKTIADATQQLSRTRQFIYSYVVDKHYELRFSGIAADVFTRIRTQVDARVGSLAPAAVKRFAAVYDNLASDNPEDWSNAVHSCRKILQDVADALFPPTLVSRNLVTADGKERVVALGADNYINRLVAFVEDRSSSERTAAVVGSHLQYLGDRLDAVFRAAQKGSHSTITSHEEADRYVVYTYMLIGDLLSLAE
jgi:hypothetical protein